MELRELEQLKELEQIVFSKSITYEKSTAFQIALDYFKKTNLEMYKMLLKKEVEEMGYIF